MHFRAAGATAAAVAVAAATGAFTFGPAWPGRGTAPAGQDASATQAATTSQAASASHAVAGRRVIAARQALPGHLASAAGQRQRPPATLFRRIQPGGPLLPAGYARIHPITNTINVVAGNWGGYAASRQGTRFRYVRASFFVPYVDCKTAPNSFSGHWAGLDGFSNGTVEQTGILAACDGSTPIYSAWYEMFPNPPVYPNIKIHPGESIVASVYYDRATRKFRVSLTDTTNGQHFSRLLGCPRGSACQRTSAEVISEAPSGKTGVLPLANFRAESFVGTKLTSASGHRDGLRSARWNTYRITTVSRSSGRVLDQPTSLMRGSAFSTYWMNPK
jgi:hypothetical protein